MYITVCDHLVMVGEGEHWNTMGGWGGDTVCVYILYIDKYITVTNGSITGLLRQLVNKS